MKSKVVDTPKDNIRFHKDMSNLDLSDSNHLAIQYNDSLFVIINYDKQLRPKSIFYIDSQIEGSSRVRFYKKQLYILKNNELFILSFPNGFNMPFVTTKKTYKREYNDFTINRMGIFLFIRGYSELIAAAEPNPEGTRIKKLPQIFKHGAFHDSGFGTTILAYTEKVFSRTKYFVSYLPSSLSKHIAHSKHSVEKKLEHSLNMSEIAAPSESNPKKFRLLQTSTLVYYIYPHMNHGQIEVFYKGSKLGKSVMVQHVQGKIETVDAGFYTDIAGDRMIVEKAERHPLRSKLFKVYSNFMHSTIQCNPPTDRHLFKGKDRKIEFEVINTAFRLKLHVTFGEQAWNKRKLQPASSSSSHNTHKEEKKSSSTHHQQEEKKKSSSAHHQSGEKKKMSSSHNTQPQPSSKKHKHNQGEKGTPHKVVQKHPKPVELKFLLVVSLGCAFLLAVLLYCYRRSKLIELKKINDIVSMDQTQDLDSSEMTDVSSMSEAQGVRPREPSEGLQDTSGLA